MSLKVTGIVMSPERRTELPGDREKEEYSLCGFQYLLDIDIFEVFTYLPNQKQQTKENKMINSLPTAQSWFPKSGHEGVNLRKITRGSVGRPGEG